MWFGVLRLLFSFFFSVSLRTFCSRNTHPKCLTLLRPRYPSWAHYWSRPAEGTITPPSIPEAPLTSANPSKKFFRTSAGTHSLSAQGERKLRRKRPFCFPEAAASAVPAEALVSEVAVSVLLGKLPSNTSFLFMSICWATFPVTWEIPSAYLDKEIHINNANDQAKINARLPLKDRYSWTLRLKAAASQSRKLFLQFDEQLTAFLFVFGFGFSP